RLRAAVLPWCRPPPACASRPLEPWAAAPHRLDALLRVLRPRYRLLPYLYTTAWRASQTGHPIGRPLLWEDEADGRLRGADDAFLLGDDLLVAPVLEKGARTRRVPFPSGAWYPLDGAQPLEGDRDVEVAAPVEHI